MGKGFDLGGLLKQAQELQGRLAAAQEAIGERVVEGSAGGGMVTVRVSGKLELQAVHVDPFLFELARGKAGRLVGDLVALLTVLKGLPATYDKDLQEDKEPLFDAADTLELALPVAAGAIATARFNHQRMRAALDEAMLATDLADYLVARGVAFRSAHHAVGELVRAAEERGVALSQLPYEVYRTTDESFGEDVLDVFDFARSAAARRVAGATAPEAVRAQIEQARTTLTAGGISPNR